MKSEEFLEHLETWDDEGWEAFFLKLLATEFRDDVTERWTKGELVPEGPWLKILLSSYKNPEILDDLESDIAFVRRQLRLRDDQLQEKDLEERFKKSLEAPQ